MRFEKKLSDDDVRHVRQLAAQGHSDAELAARFNVSTRLVQRIRAGKARRRAGGPVCKTSRTAYALTVRVARLERVVERLEKKLAAMRDALERA